MPIVVAVWPNNTISVVQVPRGFSMTDLFDQIDKEASPFDAKLYLIKPEDGWSHLTFDWECLTTPNPDTDEMVVKASSGRLGSIDGKMKRIRFPPNIRRMWARVYLGEQERHPVSKMTAEEIASMPAEPTQTYEVDEVRAMKPFCGVYFAFNNDGSCHYVGESINVTKRVTKNRPEIGDRRIGVIECERNDRRRIEAYFVAMLDPPGNAISTHRMSGEMAS